MTILSPRWRTIRLAALVCLALLCASTFYADSNIDITNRYTWGANFGWIDWRADNTNGVRLGRTFGSGNAYAANAGWISFGDGSPTNGVSYTNTSATDFGVNVDSTSDPTFALLSGKAYGANVGWINFDVLAQTGAANRPRFNKVTGQLLGFAWSANLGWMPLDSSPIAQVIVLPSTDVSSKQWGQYR